MDLGVILHPDPRSFTGRDMLQISHICRGILLVLSTCIPACAHSYLLDQWLVDSRWRLDDCSECHLWYCFLLCITLPRITDAINFPGTAQLIVAGVGIYHP